MTIDEKLDRILEGQARLFWRITDIPGVYTSSLDVLFFVQNQVNFGDLEEKAGLSLVSGYFKRDSLPRIETLMLNK